MSRPADGPRRRVPQHSPTAAGVAAPVAFLESRTDEPDVSVPDRLLSTHPPAGVPLGEAQPPGSGASSVAVPPGRRSVWNWITRQSPAKPSPIGVL